MQSCYKSYCTLMKVKMFSTSDTLGHAVELYCIKL